MKLKILLIISIIFIAVLCLFKAALYKKHGFKETLFIDTKPVYSKIVKWKGFDSKNSVAEEIIDKNFSIVWEGFFYLNKLQIIQLACLSNSECNIFIDGNCIFSNQSMPDLPIPDWKGQSNILKDIEKAWDRDISTRSATGTFRNTGDWLLIDLRRRETILGFTLDAAESPWDLSRTMEILTSNNGISYSHIMGTFDFRENSTHDYFFHPVKARYLKLINREKFIKWWSIHEIYIYTERNLFINTPRFDLPMGNHFIRVKFNNSPKLIPHMQTGSRALCKIFLKNADVIPLDEIYIYTSKINFLTYLIDKYIWIILLIPVLFIIGYILKIKSMFLYIFLLLSFFFSLYLFSLTCNQNIFSDQGRIFYTDNKECADMIKDIKASYQRGEWNDAKQHLIFPLIVFPFYKIGRVIINLPGNDNFNIVFPLTCLSLVNILLIYLMLKNIIKKSGLALILSMVYGLFFNNWLFSSLPEFIIVTTLFINLYIFVFLKYSANLQKTGYIIILAVINALAILANIYLITLFIFPLLAIFWHYDIPSRPCTQGRGKKIILYTLITICIVIISYEIVGIINKEFKFINILKYIKDYQSTWGTSTFVNFTNIKTILNTILNLFFYSIGIVFIPTFDTSNLSCFWAYFATPCGTVFFITYFAFITVCIRGLKKTGILKDRKYLILILWSCLSILYIIYFNPKEAFIYSHLVHIPWLITLVIGYSNSSFRFKNMILWLFIFSLFINNLQYIYILRHITLY